MPAEDLVRETRKARRAGPGERIAIGALVAVLLWVAATLAIPGAQGGGYLWVRFWGAIIGFFERYAAQILCLLLGTFLATVARAPTIKVPQARETQRRRKVKTLWYRPGSFEVDTDMASWTLWDGTTVRVHRRFVAQVGLFGGFHVTQEVERIKRGRREVVYETVAVEASQSEALSNRARILLEENARLRLERKIG